MTLSNLTDSHYSNWKSSSKIVIKSRFRGNCVVEQKHPGAEQWSGIHCRLKACLLLTNIWVHWNILCPTHCRAKISQNERASHTRIQFGLDNIINFVNIIIIISAIRCPLLDINLPHKPPVASVGRCLDPSRSRGLDQVLRIPPW